MTTFKRFHINHNTRQEEMEIYDYDFCNLDFELLAKILIVLYKIERKL